MDYETGAVNSLADFITTVQGFAVSNGWTLSGNVLHKSGSYTTMTVDGATIATLGGTGIDGGNNLVNPGPGPAWMAAPITASPIIFPAQYFLHTEGDELYAILRWDDKYAYLGFGISPIAGMPGTGGWYASNLLGKDSKNSIVTLGRNGQYVGYADRYNAGNSAVGWFYTTGRGGNMASAYVHHGLDGDEWSGRRTGSLNGNSRPDVEARCNITIGPLLILQPNTWNGDSVLLPVQPAIARPSNKVSVIADLKHLRILMIPNIDPEAVITLGSDQWKVYPFYRKGAALAPGSLDTGGLGFAVRYGS